jgi:hypothetical protein
VTSNSPDHLGPDEPEAVEESVGVYQPKRGLLVKVVAVLILVLLVAIPALLVLVTVNRWSEPAPSATPTTQPEEFHS